MCPKSWYARHSIQNHIVAPIVVPNILNTGPASGSVICEWCFVLNPPAWEKVKKKIRRRIKIILKKKF